MSEHRIGARVQARAVVLKTYLSSGVAVGALAAALAWPGSSQAACTTSGTTVTCSGTTTGSPNGFGTGTEDNLTVNVQTGASVTGAGVGGTGIAVRNNDSIDNSGAVSGTDRGITASTGLSVTNNMGATITGTNVTGVSAADVSLSNAGMITGGGTGVASTVGAVTITSNTGTVAGSSGVNSANGVTITNNNGGMISGDVFGIASAGSGTVNVTNTGGTITATGTSGVAVQSAGTGVINLSNTGSITSTGTGGVAVQSLNSTDINITSNSGMISGTSGGVVVQNSANPGATITVMNMTGGTIQGTGANSSAISDNTGTVKLTNSGLVTTAANGNGTIFGAMVNVTNNAGGTISSTNATFGTIFSLGNVSVTNSGDITATTFAIDASGGTAAVTNEAGSSITATGVNTIGIAGLGLNVTNKSGATISGGLDGINQQGSATTTITNGGMINGAARSGLRLGSNASVFNTGTVTGLTGIVFRDPTGTNTPVVNGSVFNSGTIAGTGGIAINFNATPGSGPFTLTLGPGFVVTGNVLGTGADVFQLGGTGAGIFDLSKIGASQQYQGFTAFNVIGGFWNTSGTFGQTQTWNVNGGTLAGTGTFAGITVNSGGTLSPGSNGAGTLTMNGSLALQSGSLYLVNVNSTTSTKAVVNGTTTISSGSTVNAVFQGTNFQNQYTILTTNGGRTGTFGSLMTMNLPSFMTATLVYLPTEVDLDIGTSLGQISGLTGNQSSVAAALDRASNSGGGLLSGLSGLTPAQIPAALDALSGQGTTGTQETALGANSLFLNTMTEQGRLWLNSETGYSLGSGGGGGGALSYADDHAKRRQHPALKAIPLKAPVEEPPRWRTWAAGFGGAWKLAGEAGIGSADLSHHTAGGAGGFDYQINPDLLVGFAAGGSSSGFSVPALATSGSVDGAHLGAYGVARWGAWYAAGALTGASFDNHTSRTIVGVGPTELATASFKSNLLSGRFELGDKRVFDGFAITPFAALQFAELWQQGFTESSITNTGTPGVLGLAFQSHQVSSLPTFLGAQFDTHLVLANGALWAPYARVSWVHEFEPTRDITATFLTLANSTFTVDGPRASRDAARIDVGSKLAITRTVSLFGTFDGEFSDRSQLYSGSGGLRVVW